MQKEQFLEWKKSEVTKEVFTIVQQVQDQFKNDLAYGKTLSAEEPYQTARYVGVIEGLNFLLNIEFEDAEPEDGEAV